MTALALTRSELLQAIALTRWHIATATAWCQWGKVSVLEASLADLIDLLDS